MTLHDTRGLPRYDTLPEFDTHSYQILENTVSQLNFQQDTELNEWKRNIIHHNMMDSDHTM